MRILCLVFQNEQEVCCAEVFHPLSPRVQLRAPRYLFVDLESTAQLLGGEHGALELALEIAKRRQLGPVRGAAIADHTYTSQLFAECISELARAAPTSALRSAATPFVMSSLGVIVSPGEDAQLFRLLPLSALVHLEGLVEWSRPPELRRAIAVLQKLGHDTLADLLSYPLPSFRERWGEVGISLWKRLHLREMQIVSPLVPRHPFVLYRHLDPPAFGVGPLLVVAKELLGDLFSRMHTQGRFAESADFLLTCDYGGRSWSLQIAPLHPSRDLKLYLDLLEQKLSTLSTSTSAANTDEIVSSWVENPVRSIEIVVRDVPERITQLDFFAPRDLQSERWQRLLSFAKQNSVEMGFLQMQAARLPEESVRLSQQAPHSLSLGDRLERLPLAVANSPVSSVSSSPAAPTATSPTKTSSLAALSGPPPSAIQVKAVYSKSTLTNPRPSLLLHEPRRLGSAELRDLRIFSFLPTERVMLDWWGSEVRHEARDYYIAETPHGERWWIFRQRGGTATVANKNGNASTTHQPNHTATNDADFFLHGYFD